MKTLASHNGFDLVRAFIGDYHVVDTRDNRVSATINFSFERGRYYGQTCTQKEPMIAVELWDMWLMVSEKCKMDLRSSICGGTMA